MRVMSSNQRHSGYFPSSGSRDSRYDSRGAPAREDNGMSSNHRQGNITGEHSASQNISRSAYNNPQNDSRDYYDSFQVGSYRPDSDRSHERLINSLPKKGDHLSNISNSNSVINESYARNSEISNSGPRSGSYQISNPNFDRYPENFGRATAAGSSNYLRSETETREDPNKYAQDINYQPEPVRQRSPEVPILQEYAGRDATFAKAREMAQRTKDILSKIGGWKSISLQPTSLPETQTTDKPSSGLVHISDSAYTRLSAKSTIAQTLLKNINLMAASLTGSTEGSSGGVAVIHRQSRPTTMEQTTQPTGQHHHPSFANQASASSSTYSHVGQSSAYGQRKEENYRQIGEAYDTGSGHQRSDRNRVGQREDPARSDNAPCDPVVADVLKSIGFNFELSQLMQERAKEKEEEERKQLKQEQEKQRMQSLYQPMGEDPGLGSWSSYGPKGGTGSRHQAVDEVTTRRLVNFIGQQRAEVDLIAARNQNAMNQSEFIEPRGQQQRRGGNEDIVEYVPTRSAPRKPPGRLYDAFSSDEDSASRSPPTKRPVTPPPMLSVPPHRVPEPPLVSRAAEVLPPDNPSWPPVLPLIPPNLLHYPPPPVFISGPRGLLPPPLQHVPPSMHSHGIPPQSVPLFPNPVRPQFMAEHRRRTATVDETEEQDWDETTAAFLRKLQTPRFGSTTNAPNSGAPDRHQSERRTESSNYFAKVTDDFTISDDSSISSDETPVASRDVRVVVRRNPVAVDDGSVIIRRTIRNDLQQGGVGATDEMKEKEVIHPTAASDIPKRDAKRRRFDPSVETPYATISPEPFVEPTRKAPEKKPRLETRNIFDERLRDEYTRQKTDRVRDDGVKNVIKTRWDTGNKYDDNSKKEWNRTFDDGANKAKRGRWDTGSEYDNKTKKEWDRFHGEFNNKKIATDARDNESKRYDKKSDYERDRGWVKYPNAKGNWYKEEESTSSALRGNRDKYTAREDGDRKTFRDKERRNEREWSREDERKWGRDRESDRRSERDKSDHRDRSVSRERRLGHSARRSRERTLEAKLRDSARRSRERSLEAKLREAARLSRERSLEAKRNKDGSVDKIKTPEKFSGKMDIGEGTGETPKTLSNEPEQDAEFRTKEKLDAQTTTDHDGNALIETERTSKEIVNDLIEDILDKIKWKTDILTSKELEQTIQVQVDDAAVLPEQKSTDLLNDNETERSIDDQVEVYSSSNVQLVLSNDESNNKIKQYSLDQDQCKSNDLQQDQEVSNISSEFEKMLESGTEVMLNDFKHIMKESSKDISNDFEPVKPSECLSNDLEEMTEDPSERTLNDIEQIIENSSKNTANDLEPKTVDLSKTTLNDIGETTVNFIDEASTKLDSTENLNTSNDEFRFVQFKSTSKEDSVLNVVPSCSVVSSLSVPDNELTTEKLVEEVEDGETTVKNAGKFGIMTDNENSTITTADERQTIVPLTVTEGAIDNDLDKTITKSNVSNTIGKLTDNYDDGEKFVNNVMNIERIENMVIDKIQDVDVSVGDLCQALDTKFDKSETGDKEVHEDVSVPKVIHAELLLHSELLVQEKLVQEMLIQEELSEVKDSLEVSKTMEQPFVFVVETNKLTDDRAFETTQNISEEAKMIEAKEIEKENTSYNDNASLLKNIDEARSDYLKIRDKDAHTESSGKNTSVNIDKQDQESDSREEDKNELNGKQNKSLDDRDQRKDLEKGDQSKATEKQDEQDKPRQEEGKSREERDRSRDDRSRNERGRSGDKRDKLRKKKSRDERDRPMDDRDTSRDKRDRSTENRDNPRDRSRSRDKRYRSRDRSDRSRDEKYRSRNDRNRSRDEHEKSVDKRETSRDQGGKSRDDRDRRSHEIDTKSRNDSRNESPKKKRYDLKNKLEELKASHSGSSRLAYEAFLQSKKEAANKNTSVVSKTVVQSRRDGKSTHPASENVRHDKHHSVKETNSNRHDSTSDTGRSQAASKHAKSSDDKHESPPKTEMELSRKSERSSKEDVSKAKLAVQKSMPAVKDATTSDASNVGYHKCDACNLTLTTLTELFEHLHSSKHKKMTHDAAKLKSPKKSEAAPSHHSGLHDSNLGLQFLAPVNGFVCTLCKLMLRSSIDAKRHVLGNKHTKEYALYKQDKLKTQKSSNLDVESTNLKVSPIQSSDVSRSFIDNHTALSIVGSLSPRARRLGSPQIGGTHRSRSGDRAVGKITNDTRREFVKEMTEILDHSVMKADVGSTEQTIGESSTIVCNYLETVLEKSPPPIEVRSMEVITDDNVRSFDVDITDNNDEAQSAIISHNFETFPNNNPRVLDENNFEIFTENNSKTLPEKLPRTHATPLEDSLKSSMLVSTLSDEIIIAKNLEENTTPSSAIVETSKERSRENVVSTDYQTFDEESNDTVDYACDSSSVDAGRGRDVIMDGIGTRWIEVDSMEVSEEEKEEETDDRPLDGVVEDRKNKEEHGKTTEGFFGKVPVADIESIERGSVCRSINEAGNRGETDDVENNSAPSARRELIRNTTVRDIDGDDMKAASGGRTGHTGTERGVDNDSGLTSGAYDDIGLHEDADTKLGACNIQTLGDYALNTNIAPMETIDDLILSKKSRETATLVEIVPLCDDAANVGETLNVPASAVDAEYPRSSQRVNSGVVTKSTPSLDNEVDDLLFKICPAEDSIENDNNENVDNFQRTHSTGEGMEEEGEEDTLMNVEQAEEELGDVRAEGEL